MTWSSRAVENTEEEEKNISMPNWLELPRDVTEKILRKLNTVELLMRARNVCSLWWNICKDPLMWRVVDFSESSRLSYSVCINLCCYAIHQSQCLIQDITLAQFANDDLLKCIANSKCQLRCLRVTYSFISDKVLSEVAVKFPLLEEVDLSFNGLSKDSLDAIGRSCPSLRVLKFNRLVVKRGYCDDGDAFAIGKTMPKLCHLELLGNQLTNTGLLAILHGCHQLKSLDLRGCFNLDLQGNLGKRCHEQVKDLKLPNDYIPQNLYSVDDYWDYICYFGAE